MISTPLTTFDISVIIPTLNEETNIEPLADQLCGNVSEIIIVDGGSTDDTLSKAKKLGLRTIQSAAGRGIQFNQGVAASRGKILVFLHADTRLPTSFSADIVNLLNSSCDIVGAFSLAVEKSTFFLRCVVCIANLRSTYLRLPYGDQCFFLTREHFDALGGFPQVEVMEDYIFIRKAKKRGQIVTLKKTVLTSARRWQRLGVFRTTIMNQLMIIGYRFGISPKNLASFYRG